MTARLAAATAVALFAVSACSPNVDRSPAMTVENPASLTVDGKKQHIDGGVSCSSHSGGFAIRVGDGPNEIFVVLDVGGAHRVKSVELGMSTGTALVSKNATYTYGDSGIYVVTGDAIPNDKSDSAAAKPFELQVNCEGAG